ncbi:MAG: DUF1552 domain-containing protein [Hyphomonadaceae bacterium]|nr:DUF1552 domain-containing protein [Hyphomonadaceae bacterium]
MAKMNRRAALRGVLGGAAVSVGVPFLDVFLDGNGAALAATGQRLPVRFGTWFWGCGITPSRFTPQMSGERYDLPADLAPIAVHRDKVSILSGFNVNLDGVPNTPHITGNLALRTGVPVPNENVAAATFDVLIADTIGAGTRFRSLEMSCLGAPHSYSYRTAGSPNPSEVSPVALYQRIFGEGFQDPNAASFTPDARTMVRQSVLSAVSDDRRALMHNLGVDDRQRMDEYFTSLRQLEQQLALQLEPPAPIENFQRPAMPGAAPLASEIDAVANTHRVMSGLLAAALACNQTRVFNMVFSDSASSLRRHGDTTSHHQLTHEELVNPELGYQEQSAFFATRSMEAWGVFIDALASVREGDGTLLDNCLVVAHSDCSLAKTHAVEGIPVLIAGRAGGRVRSGRHIEGNGDPITRIGLSVQQIMGVPIDQWGANSMQTGQTINELFV